MSIKIHFFVPGIPGTSGSKRGMPIYKGKKNNKKWTGKVAIIPANTKQQRLWMSDVKTVASQAFQEQSLLTGPIKLKLWFRFSRPKSHYGTGRNAGEIKKSAPEYITKKPDLTKLTRATEDALTGVIWRDDCQVICSHLVKTWVGGKHLPGVDVDIEELEELK